ncbi:hypothetical protein N6H18_09595 [Reichenbachiella agarivorans]|uniref:Uncharacterized protein n=1 Tax=Reichenbachiella agarivorans TaxID=2979464 RepID=A0ABY6CJA6_9BACT|nr:hypothetical protein [Reichenbachiella agarivorans]UXP30607.1 hypothetical protein N6H18_09595 [Reichenbachiella agarivorans]
MTSTILELLQRPFVQYSLFVVLTILSILLTIPKNADTTWILAGYIFIGFIVVNSIFLGFAAHNWSYILYSLGFSILYLASIAGIVPGLIKLLKIEGSDESAMIFIFVIYHPISLLCMMGLKWIYFKLF